MEPVLEEELEHGFVAKVVYDTDPMNPRQEWDNASVLVSLVDKYDGIGDKGGWNSLKDAIRSSKSYKDSWEDDYDFNHPKDIVNALGRCKDILSLPVYIYDHSGVTINTSGFSCRWDSGQFGVVFMTRAAVLENFMTKILTKKAKERAYALMKGEVETMDNYLTGQVYGYIVEDPDGEVVESCWGYYGEEKYAMEEAKSAAKHAIKEWLEKTPGSLP